MVIGAMFDIPLHYRLTEQSVMKKVIAAYRKKYKHGIPIENQSAACAALRYVFQGVGTSNTLCMRILLLRRRILSPR